MFFCHYFLSQWIPKVHCCYRPAQKELNMCFSTGKWGDLLLVLYQKPNAEFTAIPEVWGVVDHEKSRGQKTREAWGASESI